MFERLSTGWDLTRQSFRVLKLDKELLLFPAISGVACLLVLASFAVPLWNSGYVDVLLEDQEQIHDPIAYVVLFAFYFVNYFVIVFFNAALVACAVIRFKGGDPTLGDGLRAASARLPQIAGWALVSATVGIVLKLIESRSERAGQIVSGLLGMAWSVTTYFVVPVLVVERVGPVGAVKRSGSIMGKTWGEALAGQFGMGLVTFLLFRPAIAMLVLGAVALSANQAVLGVGLLVVGGVALLVVSLISSAVSAILLAALYLYAAEGRLPSNFDQDLLKHAFAKR